MKSANFIPAYRLDRRQRRRRLLGWSGGGLAYGAALAAAYLLSQAAWGEGHAAKESELGKTEACISERSQAIKAAERQLAAAELTLKANRAVGDRPDWSLLLALLAGSLDDKVVLSQCELRPISRGREATAKPGPAVEPAGQEGLFLLRLAGLGWTQAAVSDFVLRLERLGLFEQVKLIRTSRRRFLSNSAVSFELECPLEAGARRSR